LTQQRRRLALLVVSVCLWTALAEAQTGHITGTPGRPGVVVAAPHGTVDLNTDQIAERIAKRTGFGLVVATGFSYRVGSNTHRLDVNRPTERTLGGGEASETARAAEVYARYRERVEAIAQGPLLLYVEIHGNAREASAGHVEVATKGIDATTAAKLRALLEAAQAAHAASQTLQILVEPADDIYYRASAAKRHGILTLPRYAIHIELPRAARMAGDVYAEILAEFLTKAAPLLVGP